MTAKKSQKNRKRVTRAKRKPIDKKCVPVVIVEPKLANTVIKSPDVSKKIWSWAKTKPIKHLQNLVKAIKTW